MAPPPPRKTRETAQIAPGDATRLRATLAGHTDAVLSIAFDATGRLLASASEDKTVRLWDLRTRVCVGSLRPHESPTLAVVFDRSGDVLAGGCADGTIWLLRTGEDKLLRVRGQHRLSVNTLSFDPAGQVLGSAGADQTVKLWDVASRKLIRTLQAHDHSIYSISHNSDGTLLAGAGGDKIVIWNLGAGKVHRVLEGHNSLVYSVAFDPSGERLASGSADHSVKLWRTDGRLLRTLENHVDVVDVVAFSPDGRLLASKSHDGTVRIANSETWETVAVISEKKPGVWLPALTFHPTLPLLATGGSPENDADPQMGGRLIHVWELDLDRLFHGQPVATTVHYANAKVVLLGDTGVGKSGLSLVLNGRPFEATDSTPGRHVWTLDMRDVVLSGNRKQTRETLLWDLAGQPGYRIIHQLHLNEVAIALVVFDARSETDPLAGVRHWERALRLAQQRQGAQSVPLKKFLVSARTDRGGVSVSKERIQGIRDEFGFDAYFETSAKEGWQIKELRDAIQAAIVWDELPVVSSGELFARIKTFLLDVKKSGRLLAPANQLNAEFVGRDSGFVEMSLERISAQFDTCVGRLQNRDLLRRLSFGGYVLLQPELLDAYASAIVNAAKNEPDGLGSIAEEAALGGRFHVPEEQKVGDSGQEQLLLHATVEELVRHDLALRENADDGRYLVFPSQFNRDYADAPEPRGTVLAINFEGPVQSLYSTLAVRLGHSGVFEIGRTEMWRNAALFSARAGGKCGVYVREFGEARGQVMLFFEPEASVETRFHFEEYVVRHVSRRALRDSVVLTRFFVCAGCSTPVPDAYVKLKRGRGLKDFECPCGTSVSLIDPKETLTVQFESQVDAMDRSADRRRDFDAFIMSAGGETHTRNFVSWAGGDRVTLAIVFTDIVGSTALENEIGSERMSEVRRAHFAAGRAQLYEHGAREIKTIGDSFMAAFKNVDSALDFAVALSSRPGDQRIRVRVGIHVGAMQVEGNDVFGGTVNFAARVVGAIKDTGIWLSDRAKQDIDSLGAKRHAYLQWCRHDSVPMKGFPGAFTLWSLTS